MCSLALPDLIRQPSALLDALWGPQLASNRHVDGQHRPTRLSRTDPTARRRVPMRGCPGEPPRPRVARLRRSVALLPSALGDWIGGASAALTAGGRGARSTAAPLRRSVGACVAPALVGALGLTAAICAVSLILQWHVCGLSGSSILHPWPPYTARHLRSTPHRPFHLRPGNPFTPTSSATPPPYHHLHHQRFVLGNVHSILPLALEHLLCPSPPPPWRLISAGSIRMWTMRASLT